MFSLSHFPAVVVAYFHATGCAKSPESIAPSYISDVSYRPLSCQDLAISNDAVGLIVTGIPVSTMSGDNIAPEVARLKGEAEAIHRAMLVKKCG